jgi:hypothetical protein
MSEITYTPNDEPTLGNVMRRQWKTQADFTYSILGNVISIIEGRAQEREIYAR